MKKTLIALATSMLLASSAFAQVNTTDLPKPLQIPVKGGMTVESKFAAAGGLNGWVLKSPTGEYSVVFTSSDNKVLLAGALIDESGKNLTAEYTETYVPKPDFDQKWDAITKAGKEITTGAKSPKATMYVFFDPNCIFCHLFWKASKVYEKVGLQIKWIPVAYLAPDSEGKAAAILQAANPGAAMDEHEKSYDEVKHSGGIAPAKNIAAATKAKLQANAALMASLQMQGTPGVVYKDKSGTVKTFKGMPTLRQISDATGLPLQTTDDPSLARFK